MQVQAASAALAAQPRGIDLEWGPKRKGFKKRGTRWRLCWQSCGIVLSLLATNKTVQTPRPTVKAASQEPYVEELDRLFEDINL